jgi:hypothetical protein
MGTHGFNAAYPCTGKKVTRRHRASIHTREIRRDTGIAQFKEIQALQNDIRWDVVRRVHDTCPLALVLWCSDQDGRVCGRAFGVWTHVQH